MKNNNNNNKSSLKQEKYKVKKKSTNYISKTVNKNYNKYRLNISINRQRWSE